MQLRSVMVVDDSAPQRDHAVHLCRALGVADVRTAVDGADALRLLLQLAQAATLPQALIVDLEMPVMDGVELIEQLAAHRLHIPFIVASAQQAALTDSVETMARLHGLPMADTLRKPLTELRLGQALARCLQTATATAAADDAGHASREAATPIDPQRLAHAIATGAIVPHYQPQIDVRNGVIRGVEVLARWTDPALGAQRPDRFIAAAELHGQIHALTLSVMDQAFAQAARWGARGLAFSVSVNIAPPLLEVPAFGDEVLALTLRHNLPPHQIVLELTESSMVAWGGRALGLLTRLRMKGFRLSIDDYGTGFASMQQLSRLPCTELKVDRSFVDGAHGNDQKRAILQSCIEMSTRLGLETVAEGVETIEDWRLLQQFGCTMGQGWLFARAMPAADLPAWLKRHAAQLPRLRLPAQSLPQPTLSA